MSSENEIDITSKLFGPNPFQFAILRGMNRTGKHIYEGTVSSDEIARRRAKNKRAKAARKKNRS